MEKYGFKTCRFPGDEKEAARICSNYRVIDETKSTLQKIGVVMIVYKYIIPDEEDVDVDIDQTINSEEISLEEGCDSVEETSEEGFYNTDDCVNPEDINEII